MMSGGVDSSVAAALLRDEGHDVVGVTLKLWGGESDSGCCSVSDVDDARRVADLLGIEHHTFNFGEEFTRHVVGPYATEHEAGRTPNPCIECNRHIKFAAVDERATQLGFDAVATGHHAQIALLPNGTRRLARGADAAKDQSYVLHMLDQAQLARTLLPIGHMHKSEVRAVATDLGLRTASKPDSQDVCFITKATGRNSFLGERIDFTPARVIDKAGAQLGHVTAVELITVGQRKGLGLAGGAAPRYVVDVDRNGPVPTVTVGTAQDLLVDDQHVTRWAWVDGHPPSIESVDVQTSAHGSTHAARLTAVSAGSGQVLLRWAQPQRRVAAGQSVVAYHGDQVLGGGIAS